MNKILIGVIIIGVIGVVAIGAVAMMGDDGPIGSNNGEYNYSLTSTSSFNYNLGGTTLTRTADAGNVFVVATITLKNTNYSGSLSGIDTNPWYFQLNVNGVKYNHDSATYLHPNYKDLVTLEKGSKYTFTVVFQVPSGTTNAALVWDGLPSKVVYNSALV